MTSPTPTPHPEPVKHPPSWRTHARNILFAGLLILAPVYLTVYVLILLFNFMDGIFAPVIDRTIGAFIGERGVHIPGLGLLLTLLVVFFLGWLSTLVLGRRIISIFEGFIRRIPIAKTIYGATKGVLEAVSRDQADAFKRVVLIEYPRRGIYGMGFVTNTPARWFTGEPRLTELLPVFVPTTPNPTSGFLLMVPPDEVIDCPMSVEEGLRMIVSGGILQPAPSPVPVRPQAPVEEPGVFPAPPRVVTEGIPPLR
ncbi:MAG TPA: DUF502 domain-containing protein [Thermoanaerobaculia bacterium]|nr:DUF502 domain-containing protein [Thermoanaerobaculia bacterium]HSN88361.1 DUF502 domain-containing protein [Thermoanaerobaculia bacterium]